MMITRKHLLLAVLASCLLTMFLITIVPIRSSPGVHDYDPWSDVNNDGGIDGGDLSEVAARFGTAGQNISKAGLLYDSGWATCPRGSMIAFDVGAIDWSDPNISVDITGKTTPEGALLRTPGLTGQQGWEKNYGGTHADEAHSLEPAMDGGGYILAGITKSLGVGGWDVWLTKLDTSGNMLWNKTYGGTGDDYAYSLAGTGLGYTIVGQTWSFGTGGDAYLVQTDWSGNMLYNKTYGGANWDQANSVASGSGIVFAGRTASFGAGGDDFWLARIDDPGNMLWNKTYGGTGNDEALSVIQTHDAVYYIALAGYTKSFGAGGEDAWLVKTDSNGNMLWNQTYGGALDDRATSLIRTRDGGYALAGYTYSSGAGGSDFWLVKTNSTGYMLWNKTYGGTGDDKVYSLVQTLDGGYALAGSTNSYSSGDYNFELIKTDANGNLQWSATYGGTSDDNVYSLTGASDGGYVLAGATWSYGTGGDAWVIRTDQRGNIGECGLEWMFPSWPNSMWLYRGQDDYLWNYVRVQIWQRK